MEWLSSLLNGENGSAIQLVLITVGLVIALILIFWLFRRIAGTPARRAARNRVPRLSITDVTAVDDKRFLVLARRDNVEHLVMIGGPTDVVVETGIIRAQQSQANQNSQKPRSTESPSPVENTKEQQRNAIAEAPREKASEPEPIVPAAAAVATAAVGGAAVVSNEVAEVVDSAIETTTDTVTTSTAEVTAEFTENVEAVAETIDAVPDTVAEQVPEASEVAEQVAEVVEQLEPVTEPIELEEKIDLEVNLDESDLEATLSDALASEELSIDLDTPEVAVEPETVDSVPEEIAVGIPIQDEPGSPDDEMQKLLAELANETKEPA